MSTTSGFREIERLSVELTIRGLLQPNQGQLRTYELYLENKDGFHNSEALKEQETTLEQLSNDVTDKFVTALAAFRSSIEEATKSRLKEEVEAGTGVSTEPKGKGKTGAEVETKVEVEVEVEVEAESKEPTPPGLSNDIKESLLTTHTDTDLPRESTSFFARFCSRCHGGMTNTPKPRALSEDLASSQKSGDTIGASIN